MNALQGSLIALALAVPIPAPAQGPHAANYRITVAGFRVNHDTYDDPLNRDGWGDEVYASVLVQRFDRGSGRLMESRTATSQTHGDATAAPTRVPQGHASDGGGLIAGDVVPFGWDERAAKPPIEKGRFPLVVWEGPLADGGDVLVLRPSLWEQDGDRTAFDFWTRFPGSSPSATWGLSEVQRSLATTDIAPVPGPVLPGETYLPGRDRPIGLRDHKWYDQLVVLEREKIEMELQRGEQAGRSPGLIALRLKEEVGKGSTAPENGDYVLYLRVERQ